MHIFNSFWAKYSKSDENNYHPLWAHIIDVYHVCSELLAKRVPKSVIDSFGDSMEREKILKFLSFIIALHDIGKATPEFQGYNKTIMNKLIALGLISNYGRSSIAHFHAFASILILYKWIDCSELSDKDNLKEIVKYIGMHHGSIYKNCDIFSNLNAKHNNVLGDKCWQENQIDMIEYLYKLLDISIEEIGIRSLENGFMQIAGLAVMADWIGSNEIYFPFINNNMSPPEYLNISRERAVNAIICLKIGESAKIRNQSFNEYFHLNSFNPRPLQAMIDNLDISNNSLTIIQAPTGEGKTEAALYLAAKQQSGIERGGIYVAMPTQATSNSMLNRFKSFLDNSHDNEQSNLNLVLIHGNSYLMKYIKDNNDKILSISDNDTPENDEEEESYEWFATKKRALLAPYGVGTVDQVFLSILNVKHFFLRLFALSDKTIIFDEIHAYDTYMLELFERLLLWLKIVNANVIVLSATLPNLTIRRLLAAWNGGRQEIETKFPCIIQTCGNGNKILTFEASSEKEVSLKFISNDYDKISELALMYASSGCKVAVIVNMVKRSQEIFSQLENSIESNSDVEISLLHSRFMLKHRQEIEYKMLNDFGKDTDNKIGKIIVSTQIIEQSLDIDFDFIITDIAPIDLMIQRSGRLHRHNRTRPEIAKKAEMAVIIPEISEKGLSGLRETTSIYEHIYIYRTYLTLKEKSVWNFPQDYTSLVESVYYEVGESDERLDNFAKTIIDIQSIKSSLDKYSERYSNAFIKAINRLIPKPNDIKYLFQNRKITLDEEESGKHKEFMALTRLGDETYNYICLFYDGYNYYFDSGHKFEFDINKIIDNNTIRDLLFNSIRTSFRKEDIIISDGHQIVWENIRKNNRILKNYDVIVFENGNCNYKKQYIAYKDHIGLFNINGENNADF